MRIVALAPAAKSDLGDIWRYSAETWGVDRAERYVRDIEKALQDLASGLRAGSLSDIKGGYRKLPVGSHVVWFRDGEDGRIVVSRILHARMDVARHLLGTQDLDVEDYH